MKKQFFAACFVLLSAACASEQTTESTAIILDEHNMTDHTGTDFDLSAQVLKWDFILLEQNDSCRLTDIARIRFADDDIFVVNIEGVRSDLYRYDAEGRFLNRIARQDRDYGFINNVWIDKSRQRVYLPDLADRALRIYRYDGDSVSRYERYPDIEFIADAVVDDNGILGYFGITPKRRTAFFKADSILRNSVRLSASRTTSGYSGVINFSQHAISTYAGRTLFIQPFCDTLYVYAEGRITPAYVTRTGASLPPEFDFPADADCTGIGGTRILFQNWHIRNFHPPLDRVRPQSHAVRQADVAGHLLSGPDRLPSRYFSSSRFHRMFRRTSGRIVPVSGNRGVTCRYGCTGNCASRKTRKIVRTSIPG